MEALKKEFILDPVLLPINHLHYCWRQTIRFLKAPEEYVPPLSKANSMKHEFFHRKLTWDINLKLKLHRQIIRRGCDKILRFAVLGILSQPNLSQVFEGVIVQARMKPKRVQLLFVDFDALMDTSTNVDHQIISALKATRDVNNFGWGMGYNLAEASVEVENIRVRSSLTSNDQYERELTGFFSSSRRRPIAYSLHP
jgi:hypothetical protein